MNERAVVVGIESLDADAAVLGWAADEAWRAGRSLYLVHCYRRLTSTDRYWAQLMHVNEMRREKAQQVVSSAAALVHVRHPDVLVDGSSVAGPACTALIDLSHVAELLVVGRHCGTPTDAICAIAEAAACPVVFVGLQPTTSGPVVLFLDGDDLVIPVVDFAFAQAARCDSELLVVRSEPEPTGAGGGYEVAELSMRQEQLDTSLAGWQERYPQVPVTVELRGEPPVAALHWAAEVGRLLVVARRSAAIVAELDCAPGRGPIAVVPPGVRRRAEVPRPAARVEREWVHAGVDG